VFANLVDDFLDRVCKEHSLSVIRNWRKWGYGLKMTPIKVKITSWEITRKAKYRAMTARSKREWVMAPWYFESQRMMMGRKNPKSADTAGGSTPEMKVKVPGDEFCQELRKGTNAVS
jgi:hypothetical protein